MHATLYVSIYALIIIWLSMRVIKNRRKHRVSVGDGGVEELQIAMGAQSNSIEYLPITLLLLFALEFNGASAWLIHLFGLVMIAGRVIHVKGMFSKRLQHRVLGMKITIFEIIILAILNLAFFAFNLVAPLL